MVHLKALASDERYASSVAGMWPEIRKWILSPAQLKAGEMDEMPPPATCALVWGALALSAKRSEFLSKSAQWLYMELRNGHLLTHRP
jgi:hypothetical protein